jgi:putative lipoprotein (rSAM/lipoprotein system)
MAKKIYRPLTKSINWILAGILTVLGFSGCENNLDEYGSPYATYRFRGLVTNKAGNPVKNIKIEVMELHSHSEHDAIPNPILSNDDGSYYVSVGTTPTDEFRIIFSDIDGETNGSYQNDTIPVKITEKDYYDKGDGKWYYGAVEKQIDYVLKEKE